MNFEKIIAIGKKTISIERETLQELEDSISQKFAETVQFLYQSKGRIVVTGIGKSALIAKKMVATFNSTGTPSIYMHAADAIHGDLGMIKSEDVIICISKSGETPEIKVLVPIVKNLGSKVIGIVSNENSYLARRVDFPLIIPIDKEADPNNLAPTSSTTAQMAMGDAIAISLLALNGFSPKDFAQFHPGGSLGKQLYLRVADVYPNNTSPKVFLDTTLNEVVIEITTNRLGATAVLNKKNKLVGIITDGDLRRMLSAQKSENIYARDIMASNPNTIQENEMAVEALNKMRQNNISQLLVLDVDQYVGIIHLHDLIKEGLI